MLGCVPHRSPATLFIAFATLEALSSAYLTCCTQVSFGLLPDQVF